MPKPKRIVCYAINGSGLGHLTRLRTVAKWLRRYAALLDGQAPEVLFLTSSDASDSLADAGFAAFKIPSKTVARKTELSKLEYRRLAKHFVWNTLGVFSPDLLVVDTFPSGSFDELFQVLDGPFKSSFIYRNVNAAYASRATFRSALNMYDQVVAPHAPQESSRGGFGVFDGELTFSGEVVQFEREDLLPRSTVRAQLGVPENKRVIYLSAGGGGDPNAEDQLRRLVDSLAPLEDVHLLVGAGPLYRGPRFAAADLTWFDGPAIAKYFSGVDAAVSAAGYNTFHELLYARVPTAFFAQEKVADDQPARIEKALAAGACHWLRDLSDHESVRRAVEDLLHQETAGRMRAACEQWLPVNGASQCAAELLRPLYDDDRLSWARSVLSPKLASRLEQLSDDSAVFAEWLLPLLPADQLNTLGNHPSFDAVLKQLSPSAATELRDALSRGDDSLGHQRIESQLLQLFDSFASDSSVQRRRLADAALKTVTATMKKQSLANELDKDWASWICEIVEVVRAMIQGESGWSAAEYSAIERLRLFRAFPRVVDVDVSGATDLFREFLAGHASAGTPLPEIDQTIQLLKLAYSRVTRSVLEAGVIRDSVRSLEEPGP